MQFEIIGAALFVMIVSLSGVIFTHRFAGNFLEVHLKSLVSFSAGVFLVTAGALALEVFHVVPLWWQAAGLIIAGYCGAFVLHWLLPEIHHHHDPNCKHSHRSARKLIVGDAIHNVADGIILVPAFLASPALGIAVTVSILIHEILQEISEFFVLRQAGYSTRQALTINFLVSSTILIGVGLSFLAIATTELEGLLLAFSAGFFLHVVAHDLLPKRSQFVTTQALATQLGVVAFGVVLMGSVNAWLGDVHVHGDIDEHYDEHPRDEHNDEHGHDKHHDELGGVVETVHTAEVDHAD